VIVLYWVTEHFSDFEGNKEMTDFLDWFEYKLLDDVSIPAMHMHVHLPYQINELLLTYCTHVYF